MKLYLFIFLLAVCTVTFGIIKQDPSKLEEYKQRYDLYLSSLDRLAVSEHATLRRHYIVSTSDKYKDDRVLDPPTDFFQINIPAYFVMSYFVHFEDYNIVDVELFYLKVFDSGFTVIYHMHEGEKHIDYYGLNIDKGILEKQLLDVLKSREIKLRHHDDRYEKEIVLQVGYHQEPVI